MSIQIVNSIVQYDNYSELENGYYEMSEHLSKFTDKHKDVSIRLDMLIDTNELVIKTLMLKEHAN